MSRRLLSLLGVAQRAGHVAGGDREAHFAVKQGTARLLLLADDAGSATVREFTHLAEKFDLAVRRV